MGRPFNRNHKGTREYVNSTVNIRPEDRPELERLALEERCSLTEMVSILINYEHEARSLRRLKEKNVRTMDRSNGRMSANGKYK